MEEDQVRMWASKIFNKYMKFSQTFWSKVFLCENERFSTNDLLFCAEPL